MFWRAHRARTYNRALCLATRRGLSVISIVMANSPASVHGPPQAALHETAARLEEIQGQGRVTAAASAAAPDLHRRGKGGSCRGCDAGEAALPDKG